jgi:hypothetical protein
VNSGYCALCLAASASHTIDELRDDMEKVTFHRELVNLLFNFGSIEVFDGQEWPPLSLYFTIGTLKFLSFSKNPI